MTEHQLILTNANVYLTIAEEALASSQQLEAESKTPKENGEPGFVKKYDREHKSFKNALIAISFAVQFLEAEFWLVGTKKFGRNIYNKQIDHKTYEDKLRLFGIKDELLISVAAKLRQTRKELVHEKAKIISEIKPEDWRIAQTEAKEAVTLVKVLAQQLARSQIERTIPAKK